VDTLGELISPPTLVGPGETGGREGLL